MISGFTANPFELDSDFNLDTDTPSYKLPFILVMSSSGESVMDIAGYIFENPVRSGLVTLLHAYPFVGFDVWPDWRKSYSQRVGLMDKVCV